MERALFAFAVAFFLSAVRGIAVEAPHPLDDPITLESDGSRVGQVLDALASQSGLEIGFFPDRKLQIAKSRRIYLAVSNMRGWGVLDWICRAGNIRYTIAEDGSIWFGKNPALKENYDTLAYAFRTFLKIQRMVRGELDYEKECRTMEELFRGCLDGLGLKDATILRKYDICTVRAPLRAHRFLKKIMRELKATSKEEWKGVIEDWERGLRRLRSSLGKPNKFCLREVVLWKLLKQVASSTGLNIGTDTELAEATLRNIEADDAFGLLEECGKRTGGVLLLEPARGVWLRAKQNLSSTHWFYSRNPYRLEIRSYSIAEILLLLGSNPFDELRRELTRTVSPMRRRFIALYHPPTGRLVVISDPELQYRTAYCLSELAGER